jgi:outer membrane protein assembly factor BamE (lipoprotein component of BamABCDE complex)
MDMKHFIIVLLVALSSCATQPTKFKYLSLGMTKSEVLDLLGDPYSTAAHGDLEYLNYSYNRGPLSGMAVDGAPDDYFVRFKQGKVESYGKLGDFDSTKDPSKNVNINVNDNRAPSNR